ncbi:MAG: aminoacetone oxidase family FAD-binding enzyme, partial [Candidatus Gastranaerophilales bacterium]|nr:aminoacetone oxidase family FAD-binding enzyme [Candidatus Gastranaerophilales bacterium]
MEQGLIYKDIAVVGCGVAGGFASVLISKNPELKITAFDIKEPLSTLLPTGGGRCNLTYNENDIREFAKNYPRGEKFLLSVFSKFNQGKTRELFADLGIKTYVQPDNRVFPISNSSEDVVKKLKKHLETSNFIFNKEKVISIIKSNDKFTVCTEKSKYNFDAVIIATGGKSSGFKMAAALGHNIIKTAPSLTSLDIKERNFYKLSGVCFKNAEIKTSKYAVSGDILFAHRFITGPAIFKISALCAYEKINPQNPLELTIKLTDYTKDEIEEVLKNNSKKTIKNVFSSFAPESFISEIISFNKIDKNKQSAH